jgi:hypothetical protein
MMTAAARTTSSQRGRREERITGGRTGGQSLDLCII